MITNQKSSAPRGGVWKSFARKPLVSIASLYFSPQGAGNYTHTRLKKITPCVNVKSMNLTNARNIVAIAMEIGKIAIS
jgi:hypothetical protein